MLKSSQRLNKAPQKKNMFRAGNPGVLTIAANMAGRGTSNSLKK